jgi:hypothetical protein
MQCDELPMATSYGEFLEKDDILRMKYDQAANSRTYPFI